MNIIKPKVTKEGFVWLVLPNETAVEAWKSKMTDLYILCNDDSETLIENDSDILAAIQNGSQIGIEVGFIKDLLPCCPTCGSKLTPSRHGGYDWECLECDSDFIASEI